MLAFLSDFINCVSWIWSKDILRWVLQQMCWQDVLKSTFRFAYHGVKKHIFFLLNLTFQMIKKI